MTYHDETNISVIFVDCKKCTEMNGPLDPCHAGTEALEVCNTAIKNQCIISKICLKEGVTQQGFFCWVQKYCSVLKSPFFNKRKRCWWNDRHSFKWKKEKGGAHKYTTRMYCMKSSFNGGEVNIDLQPKQNHSVLLAGRKSGDSPVRMLTPNLSPPVTVSLSGCSAEFPPGQEKSSSAKISNRANR